MEATGAAAVLSTQSPETFRYQVMPHPTSLIGNV